MNDTKEKREEPLLLTELMSLIDKCKKGYKQERVFNRALALVMAELFAFGRHTITQLLLTLGITDEDWSAWYRLFSHQNDAGYRLDARVKHRQIQTRDSARATICRRVMDNADCKWI